MADGALIMNYSGHGGPNQLSHEAVVKIADFSGIESKVMPLWVTAACDILPFDGLQDNIGEAAIFNEHGGAIAFFGTTRTVYQLQNSYMNQLFTKAVLSEYNGKPVAIGEAARIAKASLAGMVTEITSGMGYADLSANKLQYTLLGDPAIKLNLPTTGMTIDSINNQTVGSGELMTLRAGDKVKVTGSMSDTSFAVLTPRNFVNHLVGTVKSTQRFALHPGKLPTSVNTVRNSTLLGLVILPICCTSSQFSVIGTGSKLRSLIYSSSQARNV